MLTSSHVNLKLKKTGSGCELTALRQARIQKRLTWNPLCQFRLSPACDIQLPESSTKFHEVVEKKKTTHTKPS